MNYPERAGAFEAIDTQPHFNTRLALEITDEVIRKIYLPFRGAEGYGTERAILVEDAHVPHRENDAEHTWHVETMALVFWDYREQLGLSFPGGFDIHKAQRFAHAHDVIEISAPDVDAMTPDQSKLDCKAQNEHVAAAEMQLTHPYMGGILSTWREYECKDTPEAQFVSDIDKIVSTRIICLDGGKKWHSWEGYSTSKERMMSRQRAKLLTDFGYALFDELIADIEKHPEYFPEGDTSQGRLF